MVSGIIGIKKDQIQMFLQDGTRVPVSIVSISPNSITQIKTKEKDGYCALQFGISRMKKANKPLSGHLKKAGISFTPRFLREIRIEEVGSFNVGSVINAGDVLKQGDIIDATGTSKGKGFAGVVKRHHFKGGPRTHGQSDRERAPGSIGQTTTPGRVYKGKRMAGKMGDSSVTIKNLQVLDVVAETVYIKGLIPGIKKGLVILKKVGEDKKFVPLFKEKIKEKTVSPDVVEKKPSSAKSVPAEVSADKQENKQEVVLNEK